MVVWSACMQCKKSVGPCLKIAHGCQQPEVLLLYSLLLSQKPKQPQPRLATMPSSSVTWRRRTGGGCSTMAAARSRCSSASCLSRWDNSVWKRLSGVSLPVRAASGWSGAGVVRG